MEMVGYYELIYLDSCISQNYLYVDCIYHLLILLLQVILERSQKIYIQDGQMHGYVGERIQ